MAIEVRVPTTGNAGEDAVVLEIRAAVGSTVNQGDIVAVLETAKASIDVEAPESGTVLDLRCAEGDEVPEHSILLVLGEPGEAVPSDDSPSAAEVTTDHSEPSTHESLPAEPAATPSPRLIPEGRRVPASPRARLLAERNGIDLAGLRGTGPGGRIIVPDVLSQKNRVGGGDSAGPVTTGPEESDYTVVPVRGARKVTAQRMTQSLQDSAQLTLNRYVHADRLLSFNSRLRAHTEANNLAKVSINDMVNFAVSQTLVNFPALNSEFSWEGIRQHRSVHLGVAVDTGSALLVPVVRSAHTMSLLQLAQATKAVVERCRSGAFEMADMEGGTFTVTNLGMFGVHWFTPVLNPPQSGILSVGAIHQPTPDQPALLPLSLTFDHRALDGAEAARALQAISEAIENIDVVSAIALPTL